MDRSTLVILAIHIVSYLIAPLMAPKVPSAQRPRDKG